MTAMRVMRTTAALTLAAAWVLTQAWPGQAAGAATSGASAVTDATNAYNTGRGGWTILTGIDIPGHGCWELSGTYQGETISFVVNVQP